MPFHIPLLLSGRPHLPLCNSWIFPLILKFYLLSRAFIHLFFCPASSSSNTKRDTLSSWCLFKHCFNYSDAYRAFTQYHITSLGFPHASSCIQQAPKTYYVLGNGCRRNLMFIQELSPPQIYIVSLHVYFTILQCFQKYEQLSYIASFGFSDSETKPMSGTQT